MGKGFMEGGIWQIFLIFTLIAIIAFAIILWVRSYDQIVYDDCIGDTLNDIDNFIDRVKKTASGVSAAEELRVRSCIEKLVFANKDWKSKLEGSVEIPCKDGADAHVMVYKRTMGAWKKAVAVKEGSKEKILTMLAPDGFCKDMYGFSFGSNVPAIIEGPTSDKTVFYCLKFTADKEKKYANVYEVSTVASKDLCVA